MTKINNIIDLKNLEALPAEILPKKTDKKKHIFTIFSKKIVSPPECEKWWTTLYYGSRGSCKSIHQAKEIQHILFYLENLYQRKPNLKPAIVFSVQKFSKEIEDKFLNKFLYYWTDAKELRFCPRKNCWRGERRHRLHGCYLVFDDIATILPSDNWTQTPIWLRKTFSQARHFGIRILANLQDPFSVDINFRRYVDMAFRFRKMFGSKDPDETKPKLKYIFGCYLRRKIKAEWLWKLGDMSDEDISIFRAKQEQEKQLTGTNVYADIFKGSFHWFSRKNCEIYDTTQDVPEYNPTGYEHHELRCTDPEHNHTDPKAPNYCGFKKITHELV